MAFENLTDKLSGIFKKLKGQATLTEKNMDDAFKEVRIALLDADVNYDVVNQFMDEVKSEAIGQKVLTKLSPGQQLIKIVHDKLEALLGGGDNDVTFNSGKPTVIMMVGLQGTGKTTTAGKLANLYKTKMKKKVLLCADDTQRPAAIDQLKTLADSIEVDCYIDRTGTKPPLIAKAAFDKARNEKYDVLIIDTAGRLQIDEPLMDEDVCTHGLHLRRYRMQSKVILSMTALLIALPAVLFFLTDFADLPIGERILASLFQSVTPRTAGYNTVDLTEMTDASQAVTILLMLTGGAPGSTAGGMKVTTLAVLIANAVAAFRRREDPQLFHRRLEHSAVRNAAAILLLYLGLTFAGAAAISAAEELPLGACLYETASAAGTVGLTLGLTPQLGVLSQSILILLMFFGRVGGLTLIYAAFSGHDLTYARYPQEKITVG